MVEIPLTESQQEEIRRFCGSKHPSGKKCDRLLADGGQINCNGFLPYQTLTRAQIEHCDYCIVKGVPYTRLASTLEDPRPPLPSAPKSLFDY